jgi:RNAse (barnase) inhibitor barstar
MSIDELLSSFVGIKLRRVVYYYWHSVETSENISLDWVEFTDHDNNIFTLQRSENDDDIICVDFNLEKKREELHKRFSGSFTIERYNATLDKFWFPILDNYVLSVNLSKSGSILIDFGDNHIIELSNAEEGIEIEFYE